MTSIVDGNIMHANVFKTGNAAGLWLLLCKNWQVSRRIVFQKLDIHRQTLLNSKFFACRSLRDFEGNGDAYEHLLQGGSHWPGEQNTANYVNQLSLHQVSITDQIYGDLCASLDQAYCMLPGWHTQIYLWHQYKQ